MKFELIDPSPKLAPQSDSWTVANGYITNLASHTTLVIGARFSVVRPELDALASLLSRPELEKAKSYLPVDKRSQSILSRGLLRTTLALATGRHGAKLRLGTNRYGKPYLEEPSEAHVKFSVSHSGDFWVCALSLSCEVGVDIEKIRPIRDLLGMAKQIMNGEEMNLWMNLEEDLREREFFKTWVEKEALLKGIGTGFSFSPKNLQQYEDRWKTRQINDLEGYACALAYQKLEFSEES